MAAVHRMGAPAAQGTGVMAGPDRVCANCGTSIVGYRRQATYCGGPCRAEASRRRHAQTIDDLTVGVDAAPPQETARNRTQRVAG
jgi:hypothetical protein